MFKPSNDMEKMLYTIKIKQQVKSTEISNFEQFKNYCEKIEYKYL